jgi:hypothetical protein
MDRDARAGAGDAPQPSSRVRLRSGALEWRAAGDEVVVLDLDRSEYFVVNASGAELWRLLADGVSVGDLTDCLVTRHGLERVQAQADVGRFLATLEKRGMLEGA